MPRSNRYAQGIRVAKQLSPIVLLLLTELFTQIDRLPIKPKATIFLLIVNIGIYILEFSDATTRRQNCLCADIILDSRNTWTSMPYHRIFNSAFLHADDWHLYYNMTSLLWKGNQLESSMGTKAFLTLCFFSLLAAHLIYLLIASFLLLFFHEETYYSCAVGFSAVLFSLKYVLNHNSPTMTQIHGMAVPLKYACWLELVLASLISPNVSFVGHLAGILAGMLWVHGPKGALPL